MPHAESRSRGINRNLQWTGLLGLYLMVTACTSIQTEPETKSVVVNNPTPADTAAPETAVPDTAVPETSAQGDSKIAETTDPVQEETPKNPWPLGVKVIDPNRLDQGLQLHRNGLQNRSDIALAPAEVGYYVDNMQARFIQKLRIPGVSFARQADVITIRIAGVQTFDTDSYRLKPEIENGLAPLGEVLEEYNKTLILIAGHTDDSGPEEYNQKLSEQRALSLTRILIDAGVNPRRIVAVGFGELEPLQPNNSEAARFANRRLELRIEPVVAGGN